MIRSWTKRKCPRHEAFPELKVDADRQLPATTAIAHSTFLAGGLYGGEREYQRSGRATLRYLSMATAHLIFGYLGAGKTTFAVALNRSARHPLHETMDVETIRQRSPVDSLRVLQRVSGLIESLLAEMLRLGVDVVLDLALERQ